MRRTRTAGVAAAVCLSLLFTVACSSDEADKSAEEIRRDLVGSLQAGDPDLDDQKAGCFVDAIVDEVGLERLREVDLADRAPEGGLDQDIVTAAIGAAEECNLSGPE
jgi:hypothetical protein